MGRIRLESPAKVAFSQVELPTTEALCCSGVCPVGVQRWDCVLRLRAILGGPPDFLPFQFRFPDGSFYAAHNSGLEGFLYTLEEIEDMHGVDHVLTLFPSFVYYVRDLLHLTGWDHISLKRFEMEAPSVVEMRKVYEEFIEYLYGIVDKVRTSLRDIDPSLWIRESCIYQIYTRAFNLQGLREELGINLGEGCSFLIGDFKANDLFAPFSAIRWTGTYPIGTIDVKGIGSPYSIKDHSSISEHLGGARQVKENLALLDSQGIKTIFELSPNHTAVDGVLLEEDPTLYIHKTEKPADLNGYYHYIHKKSGKEYWIRRGGYMYDADRFYWDDTLQLDLSNQGTRQALIDILKRLVREYGVHGFRVDMAYQLLNVPFDRTWGDEASQRYGNRLEDEFFAQLISGVKSEYPWVAFIAEGFHSWDRLAAVGFDVIYSKNDMHLPGNLYHHGWYNALTSRDPWKLRWAIKRAAFLQWQKGSSSMLAFVGHHDLPAPQLEFGEWVWGATALTLMLPVTRNWYAATEAGFSFPCSENGKMISFAEDVQIDWHGVNGRFAKFVRKCIEQIQGLIKKVFADSDLDLRIVPLLPDRKDFDAPWVGYLIRSYLASDTLYYNPAPEQIIVLVNPSKRPCTVKINDPFLGLAHFSMELGECGEEGVYIA